MAVHDLSARRRTDTKFCDPEYLADFKYVLYHHCELPPGVYSKIQKEK
jgi:hypothetical protein